MKDYNKLLDEMIKECNLPLIDTQKLEQTSDWNIAVFDEKCMGKRVALWGAGDGNETTSMAAVLLNYYATYLKETVCIIDSNPKLWGTRFLDIPIIDPDSITKWKIECIVISTSPRWRTEVAKKCLDYVSGENIIIPQTEIIMDACRESNFYLYIHLLRMQYIESTHREERRSKLLELIACYLAIRDFAYAFYFIEEYINAGYDSGQVGRLNLEIHKLLQEMQCAIQDRKNDILILFPDRLNRRECEKIDMFSCIREKSLVFSDANATALYTYESMASIVAGVMPFEKEVYRGSMAYTLDEAMSLRKAGEKGYQFYIETIPGYPIFQGERFHIRYSAFASQKLWNALCTLCETEGKVLEYLYIFETHYPDICGYHEGKSYDELLDTLKDNTKSFRTNYQDCLQYIDTEFTFYEKLFPEKMKIVIHSDHSFLPADDEKEAGKRNRMLKKKQYCVEVPLLIKGAGITGSFDGMFSMIDFPDVLNQIVAEEKLVIPEREIINYQMEPVHSRTWRARLVEEGLGKYAEAVNVYVSRNYICLIAGEEDAEVYSVDNIDLEISDTQEGKAFLEKISYTPKENICTKVSDIR